VALAALNGRADRPKSPIDRLDPRTRVLATVGFAVAAAVQDDPVRLLGALLVAVALLAVARLPATLVAQRVAALEVLVLLVVATLPFTLPGDPVARLGPLTASDAGLARALVVALRANAVALAVLALLGGLDATRFGRALAQLRVPSGLVAVLAFATRYVGVLEREWARVLDGMRARGFRPRSDRRTYRALGYLVGAMVVRAFERADRVLEAMRCRGFDGRYPTAAERRYPRREGALLALVAAALATFAIGGAG
jgi:cobalt/nickel transport system permease protein